MGLTAQGVGKSQWVQRPTDKPGAILTRVRVPGAARDLYLLLSQLSVQTPSTGLRHPSFNEEGAGKRCSECAFSADSVTVSVQPPCATACINICVHVKNPNTDSKNVVRTQENTTDTDRNG